MGGKGGRDRRETEGGSKKKEGEGGREGTRGEVWEERRVREGVWMGKEGETGGREREGGGEGIRIFTSRVGNPTNLPVEDFEN